ncbi:MAG TPA: hypothetical protein VMT92_09855 [Steroidobacteraceae bacterium]|nr:hypothetical protein [Steroidobacteraceae bacterium]
MTHERNWLACATRFLIPLLVVLAVPTAEAVPSFARQTGMACEACHTVWPELTHFGRVFKANGYILDNLKQVRGVTQQKEEILELASLPPLSLMVQVSMTQLATPLPDSSGTGQSQNGTVAFPQQVSLFYAGKIAPHVGAFMQLTYGNDGGTIGIDNTDIRITDLKVLPDNKSLIYGLSLNNNPTVQDLWNSTPAFGFPYAASNSAPGVPFGTMIDGALGQDVAGLTAYAFWNESLYGELGLYRTARQGTAGPLDSTQSAVLSGVAPYWRFAYEHNWGRHSIEGGVYGATFKLLPGGGTPLSGSPTDQFQDIAEDVQYQYLGDQHLFSVTATRIHEKQTLDATYAGGAGGSANADNDLTTLRGFATYYYRRKVGGTVGFFRTTGSDDAGLYGASGNTSPDTTGWIAEINYMPWLNTKFSIQYTGYTKYSGGSNYLWCNADCSVTVPRKASDNNTLYILAWLSY